MPFGAVFAAVVLGVLGLGFGGRLLADPAAPGFLSRAVWGGLGAVMLVSLLTRRPWSRWLATGASLLLLAIGGRQVLSRGYLLDHVTVLASAASALLLIVPATGRLRGPLAADGTPVPRRRLDRPLAWTGAATFSAAVLLAMWSVGRAREVSLPQRLPGAATASAPPSRAMTPAPAGAKRPATGEGIAWKEYETGRRLARETGKPVLVDFYASWCGPCRLMERVTFRDSEVVRMLGDLVAVRVDAGGEDTQDGAAGADLASRHRVSGFPTLVLLDPQGREISRRTGYLDPDAMLTWLHRALGPSDRAVSGGAEVVSRPGS